MVLGTASDRETTLPRYCQKLPGRYRDQASQVGEMERDTHKEMDEYTPPEEASNPANPASLSLCSSERLTRQTSEESSVGDLKRYVHSFFSYTLH